MINVNDVLDAKLEESYAWANGTTSEQSLYGLLTRKENQSLAQRVNETGSLTMLQDWCVKSFRDITLDELLSNSAVQAGNRLMASSFRNIIASAETGLLNSKSPLFGILLNDPILAVVREGEREFKTLVGANHRLFSLILALHHGGLGFEQIKDTTMRTQIWDIDCDSLRDLHIFKTSKESTRFDTMVSIVKAAIAADNQTRKVSVDEKQRIKASGVLNTYSRVELLQPLEIIGISLGDNPVFEQARHLFKLYAIEYGMFRDAIPFNCDVVPGSKPVINGNIFEGFTINTLTQIFKGLWESSINAAMTQIISGRFPDDCKKICALNRSTYKRQAKLINEFCFEEGGLLTAVEALYNEEEYNIARNIKALKSDLAFNFIRWVLDHEEYSEMLITEVPSNGSASIPKKQKPQKMHVADLLAF